MAEERVEVVSSRKGKPMISKQGYLFQFAKDGMEKKIWMCDQRLKLKCPVRLHTSDNLTNPRVLSELGTHNPNAIACEIKKAMGNIRMDSATPTLPPAIIIANNVRGMSSAAQGLFPLIQNVKRGIHYVRSASIGAIAIPHRREEINLPEVYTVTSAGKPFLLFDSGPSADRIMIFSIKDNLKFLQYSNTWFADRTFKSCPTLFNQLFIIHGYRNGAMLPLVYCLTPNRDTVTYTRAFWALKNLNPGLDPLTIVADYETASMNAFAEEFPRAERKRCFFHMSQCIFRQIF
jgi:hypothetical protein